MVNPGTTYMGIELSNPVIAGACGLTSDLDMIKRIEAAGAGAIVLKSLFEEQIQLERFNFDEDLEKYNYRNAEMTEMFPRMTYNGPEEYLMRVREIKSAVRIPVIASLNAVNRSTWIEYAGRLAGTGVDGLEISLSAPPGDPERKSDNIEASQVELVRELKKTISIPLSVKLSPSYTNIVNVAALMDRAGADAFVLFNKLFLPDIDLQKRRIVSPITFSDESDSRQPLRYAALLSDVIKADICCSTGIMSGKEAVKMILAGAAAVQVVSTLYRHGVSRIGEIVRGLSEWMESNGYATVPEFRGKLSRQHVAEPWAYTRAQYARLLMNTDEVTRNAPVI